jgi:hypothetical protein
MLVIHLQVATSGQIYSCEKSRALNTRARGEDVIWERSRRQSEPFGGVCVLAVLLLLPQ